MEEQGIIPTEKAMYECWQDYGFKQSIKCKGQQGQSGYEQYIRWY